MANDKAIGKNWQPSIDQKVISLISAGRVVEGLVYTVADVKKCKCGTFHVFLKEIPLDGGPRITSCDDCNGKLIGDIPPFSSLRSCRLAPIQSKYEDATAEILEKFKPFEGVETDCPVIKEPTLS